MAYQQQSYDPAWHKPMPQKNYIIALLLSIFLGSFGVDRFYLGHIGHGIAKLLLSWMTFGIWWLLDLILVATRKVKSDNFVWDDLPQRRY